MTNCLYTLQRSEDTRVWQDYRNVAGANAEVAWTEPVTNKPALFYRVLLP